MIGQFAWGWWMQEIPKQPPGMRADAFNLHKSVGLLLLALMLVRLGWRIAHPAPPLPAMPSWEAKLAQATHVLLYVVLFVMPLSGYLGSVFSGYPVKWSGQHDRAAYRGSIKHALARDGVMARMMFDRANGL